MLKLKIKGYHIPGKKIRHYAGRNGRILIDKKTLEKIKALEADIESQLLSVMRIELGETTTMEQQRSWIASRLFEDDCWKDIPEEHYYSKLVPSIEEAGCEIVIERLHEEDN
jgi:hypothetical protein